MAFVCNDARLKIERANKHSRISVLHFGQIIVGSIIASPINSEYSQTAGESESGNSRPL